MVLYQALSPKIFHVQLFTHTHKSQKLMESLGMWLVYFIFIQFIMEVLDESLAIDGINCAEEVPKTLKLLG